MRRLLRLIALGRMVEKGLAGQEGAAYLIKHGRGTALRVNGTWPLAPGQARMIRRALEVEG